MVSGPRYAQGFSMPGYRVTCTIKSPVITTPPVEPFIESAHLLKKGHRDSHRAGNMVFNQPAGFNDLPFVVKMLCCFFIQAEITVICNDHAVFRKGKTASKTNVFFTDKGV